jgi:carbon monoxide dehydrogenase subunit G
MEFTNEITLALPTDDVFAALTDVERVASCLPGARIEGRDGDAYRGAMRIKVGPILADYRGSLQFDELDATARRAVLLASGEEATGQGSAHARIVSSVIEDGDHARVVVQTDLQVAGRVAQFGSGAMEKIAKRMFADFAKNLERLMTSDTGQVASSSSNGAAPHAANTRGPADRLAGGDDRPPAAADAAPDSLDVLDLVGAPLAQALRGAVPVLVSLLIGYLLGQLRARPPVQRR